MNKLFQVKVSLYQDVKDTEPREAGLWRLLLSDKWKNDVERVRQEADPMRQKQLKNGLPCFTPSGVFSGKTADTLKQHSGFVCIDVDAKDNANVKNFADFKNLVAKVPHVAYCGLSVRGAGYFCLVPIADPAKHAEYFRSLVHLFKKGGITIDRACSNVNRLRFVSYDPDPYINTAAQVFDSVLPIQDHSVKEVFGRTMSETETKDKFEAVVKEIAERRIDITGGYPQWFEILCAIASTFGEDGRDAAHTVSSQADSYSRSETDRKFDEALKHCGYGYTIGTFFFHARRELGLHVFDGITDLEGI